MQKRIQKIKQFRLYHMNYLQGIFKPMLSMKLNLTGLCSVSFKIDCINDSFELSGIGISKKNNIFGESKMLPQKISENKEYKDICDKNIFKNVPDCKEYYLAYIKIDFSQKFVNTEVFYLKTSGLKNRKQFKNSF